MFGLLLRKEVKVFFTNRGNLVFMVLLPILLMTIFSAALGSYIEVDYGTFEDGKVLYYEDQTTLEIMAEFTQMATQITNATGVSFEAVSDDEQARKDVEASRAYGVITITADGFDYYRSSFNEPEGGELVRTLFVQLAQNGAVSAESAVQKTVLEAAPVNSKAYYSFAAVAFAILFMGLLIAHSVYDEKELDTIVRIRLSKAGIGAMLASKVITGVLCGMVQIVIAYLFSTLVLGVDWGVKLVWIFLLLLLLVLYSAVFGALVGMLSKNKSMCQSTVMMISMLCGYLGGSITPLYLLENMPVLNTIVKISPLYWTNRAITSLYNNVLDRQTLYSALVLLGLVTVMLIAFGILFVKQRSHTETQKEVARS